MHPESVKLSRLLEGFAPVPGPDPEVGGLSLDTRSLRPGELFFACPGLRDDGRRHLDAAVRAGACAVLMEPADSAPEIGIPCLAIPNLRERIGPIAARFYGEPSRGLTVCAVTGTNGKTTCAELLGQAWRHLGRRSAVIGTLGVGEAGGPADAASGLTTPDALSLQRSLAELRGAGYAVVCLEASSHGLDQGRLNGVAADTAIFTNLSRDHLDYHADMDDYFEAKARLFRLPGLRLAVLNAADACYPALRGRVRAEHCITYGAGGDLTVDDLHESAAGLSGTLHHAGHSAKFESRLLGRLNLDNLLAVVASLIGGGRSLAESAALLGRLTPPPGRLESFPPAGDPAEHPRLIVDYAHTPDALEAALLALRPLCAGKLWCVFGCGGERDPGKRAPMGEIAARLADHVVITNDNPRHESPQAIAEAIRKGAPQAEVLLDRRMAIEQAFDRAGPRDWVLIAGRGHESVQDCGDIRHPLSDRNLAAELTRRPRAEAPSSC